MRRWNALFFAVSVATVATPITVFGDTCGDHLFVQTDYVQFEVILGRITTKNACHGKARIATRGDLESGDGEVLTVRVTEGVPRIRYDARGPDKQITVTAIGADRIVLERRLVKDDIEEVVRYEQHPDANVKLTVQKADNKRVYSAPSLWHLWIKHPRACDNKLASCLKVLRPNWNFGVELAEVEQALFETATMPTQSNYVTWLAELADDRYRVRQNAFRKFQEAGVSAKAFLERVDRRSLDGEQRMRVHQLKQSLVFRTEDSSDRVATWLREDRRVWFAYLKHRQKAKRCAAYAQLKRIYGEKSPLGKLPFDPEAPAESQATQIASLQSHVFPP
jgi:hypothetical protein